MEKLGIRLERLQLEWISTAEGLRFSSIMKEMEELRKTVVKEEIQETVKILKTYHIYNPTFDTRILYVTA